MALLNRVVLSLMLVGAMLPLCADIGVSMGGVACAPAGLCTSVAGATTITFDGLLNTETSPYTDGFATYTWSSSDSPFVTGSISGESAAPPGDTTTYLTVGSGSGRPDTVTITFAKPIWYFGFYLGSPDRYNVAAFKNGAVIKEFNGDQMIPPGANGNQAVGAFVNFFVTGGATPFDEIVMRSSVVEGDPSTPAFETDNHAYAVPEPASILGFGTLLLFLGSRLRRKMV